MGRQTYIGVDPGAQGFLCHLDTTNNIIEFQSCAATPVEIDAFIQACAPAKIMIEDVHSLAKMSAKSNFGFGRNVGFIHALCGLEPCGVDLVTPKVWQKTIGIKPGSKTLKKDVATIAHRLYPTAELYGPQGGLIDGKADALMIAHFCLLRYGHQNANQT